HFHDEEEYMKSVDYEGLQAQIYAHQAFVDRLNEVNLEAVDEDQEGYLRELIDFLAGWLINHILKMDKKIPAKK
ncbi:MAG: hemerythrin family protein, partial [Lachnospiraceae bacterium]|nr:hemerythrin family protein [Lachnospiraceae bacterium]